ncbi:MAG: gephyrin-like molybdotransferase Glp [Thermomicrobiaceae bacterium]
MTATDRLIPPQEALDIVFREVNRRLPAEEIDLLDAPGRIIAEPLVADRDLPPFPASTMDGFAVIASDVSPWREIIGDQFAGDMHDFEVTEGTCARIMTGAPVPKGADSVVPVELTELRDDHMVADEDLIVEGANIRPIGSDLREGDVLIQAGTQLGPAEVGLLASLGHARVKVVQRPKVSVLSTGDELVEPDQEPGPGQIRDSNRFSLKAAAEAFGCDVIFCGHGPDEEDKLRTLVTDLMSRSDIVITSGGVSVGDRDLLKALFMELGDVHFQRLFMKPGKPLNFMTSGETLVFGLPGNPVSALVGFEVFIKTAIRILSGQPDPAPRLATVRLADEHVQSSDRIEYMRAVVTTDEQGTLWAHTNGPQQSARLMSLVGANALILIAPRETSYERDEVVEAIITGQISRQDVTP